MKGGQGWRTLRVAHRAMECEKIVSLHLEAADGAALPPFRPGQFLTFRLRDASGRAIPRNYSISSDPQDLSHYRISVRREEHSRVGARHMHGAMPVGATIEATEPKGRFWLDGSSRRPVILLAGGIGITPLMAMAHALARDGGRRSRLVHDWEDGPRPFEAELQAMAAAPNFRAVQSSVSRDVLESLLPIGDYEAYLCGPEAFMQTAYDLLLELGLREERIAYEFFGPAKRLVAGGGAAVAAPPPAVAVGPVEDGAILITFAKSGRAAVWDGGSRTLLDFAEARGLAPAFSCRNGVCNTCICKVEGEVRYIEEPLEAPGAGQALLCCSVPVGSVTLGI
jgi:ferredoxin-NADP reductase